MAKRSSKKREHDFSVRAFRVVQAVTAEPDANQININQQVPPVPLGKNPNAVALGRLGGQKGGKARAEKLTPEQRREIARRAASARWSGRKP